VVWNLADGFQRDIHDITNAPFRTKFEDNIGRYRGTLGLGVISDYENQPMLMRSHHGSYAIATVGRIDNLEALAREVLQKAGTHFGQFTGVEVNPTELVGALINQEATLLAGIRAAQERIKGSCSMLLLTAEGIYAARDRLGRTPLILGKKNGALAATFETCAFPNLGFEVDHSLGPAEIVHFTAEGREQLRAPEDRLQICAFLWIYYGFPASSYEGVNIEAARNRCGAALARGDDVEVDLVAGIPDSGVGHAIGYATTRGILYRRPFAKYTPTWPRSFMPQEQRVRELVAKMKLIPIREIIQGQRVLFCEDSIVRGTQLQDVIRRVFDAGATEVHMRPACPPLVYGCKYLNFSRSKSELDLAARKAVQDLEGGAPKHLEEYTNPTRECYHRMVDSIRARLGLTTLRYLNLGDMIEAIGLPQSKLCTYCWTGQSLHE